MSNYVNGFSQLNKLVENRTKIEVTKHAIKSAAFVAIDFEMSGGLSILNASKERQLWYALYRDTVSNFAPVQLGFCTAHYSECLNNPPTWILHPTSFLIGPTPKTIFKTSIETLRFLRSNGFNFNQWIDELHTIQSEHSDLENIEKWKEQIDILVNKSEAAAVTHQPSSISLDMISTEDQPFFEMIRTKITSWEKDINSGPLHLITCNSREQKLLKSILHVQWPDLYYKKQTKNTSLLFKNETDAKNYFIRRLEQKIDRKKIAGDSHVRHIIQEITKNKICLIGYNHLLDLLYMGHYFYSPLPKAFNELQFYLSSMINNTIDTEMLGQSLHGPPKLSLIDLCDYFYFTLFSSSSSPFNIKVTGPEAEIYTNFMLRYPKAFTNTQILKSSNPVDCHHAGYDALITTFLFLMELHMRKGDFKWKDIIFHQETNDELSNASLRNILHDVAGKVRTRNQVYIDIYKEQTITPSFEQDETEQWEKEKYHYIDIDSTD